MDGKQRGRALGAGGGLLAGLATTARTMLRPAVTQEYPDVAPELPPRSRGVIALLEENCTSCMLCARECPDWCIYIDSHKETVPGTAGGRDRQRNVLDRFAIDFSLCMYCGICIEVCPFDALFWAPEFEYSEFDIRDLTHEKARLGQWMASVPPPPALDPRAPQAREVGAATAAADKVMAEFEAARVAAGTGPGPAAAASGSPLVAPDVEVAEVAEVTSEPEDGAPEVGASARAPESRSGPQESAAEVGASVPVGPVVEGPEESGPEESARGAGGAEVASTEAAAKPVKKTAARAPRKTAQAATPRAPRKTAQKKATTSTRKTAASAKAAATDEAPATDRSAAGEVAATAAEAARSEGPAVPGGADAGAAGGSGGAGTGAGADDERAEGS